MEEELELYFPSLFDVTAVADYYSRVKKAALAKLDAIVEGIDNSEDVAKYTKEIVTFNPPKSFSGKNGVEVRVDKEYEQMCILISSELHMDAKAMTVREYYAAYEFLDERSRKYKAQKARR